MPIKLSTDSTPRSIASANTGFLRAKKNQTKGKWGTIASYLLFTAATVMAAHLILHTGIQPLDSKVTAGLSGLLFLGGTAFTVYYVAQRIFKNRHQKHLSPENIYNALRQVERQAVATEMIKELNRSAYRNFLENINQRQEIDPIVEKAIKNNRRKLLSNPDVSANFLMPSVIQKGNETFESLQSLLRDTDLDPSQPMKFRGRVEHSDWKKSGSFEIPSEQMQLIIQILKMMEEANLTPEQIQSMSKKLMDRQALLQTIIRWS